MAKGERFQSCFYTFQDPYTGTSVKRLTDPGILSHHMYFYNRMTTSDGKKLLVCQLREEGRQLYLLDLNSGELLQITEGEKVGQDSAMFSSDDRFIYYQQGKSYYRMDAGSLESECYYTVPDGWSGGAAGMSDDCRFMAVIESEDKSFPKKKEDKGWSFFAQACLAKPHCRIVYVDTLTGRSHIVLDECCWLGHPQIRPKDPDTILFCHEGPYDLIDARLWLVQSDGSRLRCCREQPSDLILTHEFWLPDGSRLAYVYRETTGSKEENIRMMDPETLQEEIFMECSPYAHFICDHRQEYMVGDAQSSDKPIHLLTEDDLKAQKGPGNNFIYLIDMKKREERKLAWHGTSWLDRHGNPQDCHPHPCFTQDNRSVIFVSDREGFPCIYQIEL